MSWKPLCPDDPLEKVIRERYLATPLRVPSSNVEPMLLFASDETRFRRLGSLRSALSETIPITIEIRSELITNAATVRSSTMTSRTGMRILSDLLSGFGVASLGVEGAFNQRG